MNELPQHSTRKKIDLQLNNGGKFFKDKVEETREIWLSKLKESFELVEGINFVAPPDGEAIHTRPCVVNKFSDNNKKDILNSQKLMGSSEIVNVKDKDKWPLANLIIDHFPGTIKKTGVDD